MISVIIPVYNDRKIKDCLAALCQSSFLDKEILVIDNNSTDPEIKKIVDKFPVKYFLEPQHGSYHARQHGFMRASGEIIAFLDSDCVIHDNWFNEIQKQLSSNLDGLFGGIEGINGNKIAALEQRFYIDIVNTFIHDEKLKRIDTRNFIIRRNALEQVGGFNVMLKFGGDMELGARLHQAGYIIKYASSVLVKHQNETNLKKLIAKRIKQNIDNTQILKYHKTDFIETYFPHLLQLHEYKKYYWLFKLTLPIAIFMTQITKNYFWFKLSNKLAIKIGLLYGISKNFQ